MTKLKIEPSRAITNFLRKNLVDINSSRSGNWVFDDFPRIEDLGNASFPRIGITSLSMSANKTGIFDNTWRDVLTVQIDIIAKKGNVYSVTTTDEALGTMSSSANSDRMTYNYVPTTVTNIKHAETAFGTVTFVNTDSDFTAPAAGTVQVSRSTGNLNFAAADIAAYDTQAITSTSINALEGKKSVTYLANKIRKLMKNSFRTDTEINFLFNPVKLNDIPLNFDEDLGIFRHMMEYRFEVFNAGEGL